MAVDDRSPAGVAGAPGDTDSAAAAARVLRRCDDIAGCTETPGRITRRYGTPALSAGLGLVDRWMREAGLETRRDAIGNLIGRLPGPDNGAPPLVLGSHLDSVPDGGRYDGPLGVLVALEAVEQATRAHGQLSYPVDVVAFADEEGTRFHTTYLGSRAFAGTFDSGLLARTDAEGVSLADACVAFGGDPSALAADACSPILPMGYVEVHIEQGPALETLGAPLGVVTAIAGQSRIAVSLEGRAGHAGTVAMDLRHDALAAAAEVVLAAERLARETTGLLATVGQLAVSPGASNVVPGETRLSLDVRSPNDQTRAAALESLRHAAEAAGDARGVTVTWEVVQENPAIPMDEPLSSHLADAVASLGLPVHRLASGAGHDAVVMASVCPVAMLFVRCAGGVSHHPDESVTAEDVAIATRALAIALPHLGVSPTPVEHRDVSL